MTIKQSRKRVTLGVRQADYLFLAKSSNFYVQSDRQVLLRLNAQFFPKLANTIDHSPHLHRAALDDLCLRCDEPRRFMAGHSYVRSNPSNTNPVFPLSGDVREFYYRRNERWNA